jgi:hypothetical protein
MWGIIGLLLTLGLSWALIGMKDATIRAMRGNNRSLRRTLRSQERCIESYRRLMSARSAPDSGIEID